MTTFKTPVIIIWLLFTATASFAQGKVVDKFKIKKSIVNVTFYDPILTLVKNLDFESKSDKEKSDSLNVYLHNNPLYLFEVITEKTKDTTYLCIRGNPERTDTKWFYKVEVIKGLNAAFDPAANNYSDKIVKVIDNVNCGGVLFESSEMFSSPENKKYVGNGILLFGYYHRVQPYSEIRESMTNIIKQLLP